MMQHGVHKKLFPSLLLALILLLSTLPPALAMTEVEWNRSCRSKTRETTTIYEQIPLQQEEGALQQYEYRPIGSLPANTYVKVHTRYDADGYRKISYWKGGDAVSCYVAKSPYPLTGATAYVQTVIDGYSGVCVTEVPEAYLDDKNALRKYIREKHPGVRLLEDSEKDSLEWGPGDSLHLPENGNSSASSSSGSKKTVSAPRETVTVHYNDNTVQLIHLGIANSTVLLNGEEKAVPTARLDFGSKAEKEKQTAVIHAPKSGTCTLRAKASDSGKMLKKCKAGTVVMVLETGSRWSKISYKDTVGYVLTGCLKWYDAQTEGTGLLSYNGRATGSTTVNVRNAPSGDSAKIAEWPTGTEVEIFGLEKGWYEIEYKGIHGFVMEKYLTVQQ